MKDGVATMEAVREVIRLGDEPSDFPSALRAGDFVFAPCITRSRAEARRDIRLWQSAEEGRVVTERLGQVMAAAGGRLENVINLLQCFRGRGQTAGYVVERIGHYPKGVPTSTGTACTELSTPSALIQLDAIGVLPSDGRALVYAGGASKNAAYSNAVLYGDYVFASGIMTNAPETQPDPKLWFGSPVQLELRNIVEVKLKAVYADAGCGLADVQVAHFHLLHPEADFGQFCRLVDSLWPEEKPVILVSASSGLGALPGRIELTPIALLPGSGLTRESITPAGHPGGLAGGPAARRVGDYLFTTTLIAGDHLGLDPALEARASESLLLDRSLLEMESILGQLGAIAEAAGGSLADLARVRLYSHRMRDASVALAALRAAVGSDIPVSLVEDAGGEGWLPGCSLSADAVFYLP